MVLVRQYNKALADGGKILPSEIVGGGLTTGNVYYVIKSTETFYAAFQKDNDFEYTDRSRSVHTTIQSALDACVANRDDYVIVTPSASDYDITAALTMSKARTHLICPAGLGHRGFPSNAARIHQTGAFSHFTVSADTVEIAGFFFKGASGENIIDMSSTRWHAHIHDNFFGMSATDGSDNYGINGTGANNHFSIHDNYFTNYLPGAVTGTDNDLGSFIFLNSASNTRGLIRDNYFVTGANTEVTAGIQCQGIDIVIDDNIFLETVGSGGSQDGIFTVGIASGVGSMVLRNHFAMDQANEVSGGTADESYTQNFESTSGGTVVT